ncbi:NADP-dependent oxidoreductase [Nocardia sp. GCM10030253]|uniref:NADP-dependent oxidoreductase n=1 Tax=Nocardia sp. GCM10030253 TaxID=3273404 RepID=UPI0036275726
MRAIAFDEFGGPDVLKVVDVPIPEPGEGEVRVAVRAAGVNPADWKIRSGALTFGDPVFPQYPGGEVAGVVDAVGPSVTGVAVGDEVFGWARRGGYAEYALSGAVARKPAGLDWADAVALPVAVSTADTVLKSLRLKPGETLLINGAAGAVGSMAVQLAVADGVIVIGTASPANQDIVRALGATATTYGDGLADRVRALAPTGIDAVFDAAGHGVLPAAIELRGGTDRIVTIADPAAFELGVTFTSAGGAPRPTALAQQVAERVAKGEFRLPGSARVFPFDQAAAAQQESETGRGPGKVVLLVR